MPVHEISESFAVCSLVVLLLNSIFSIFLVVWLKADKVSCTLKSRGQLFEEIHWIGGFSAGVQVTVDISVDNIRRQA